MLNFTGRNVFGILAIPALAVALVLSHGEQTQAADPGPNPGVPELKILQKFFGTWEGSVGNSEETIHARREWILDGRFLRHEFTLSNGAVSGTIFRSYDTRQKHYVMVFLDSTGNTSHLTGQWSPEQNTLTFEATSSSMFIQKYESYFPDEKTEKWTATFQTDGNSGEITGTARRKD
jgi:hypothetical protein